MQLVPVRPVRNWIPTKAGRPWISFFRIYGSDKPLFEKTWTLSDIEKHT